MKTLGSPPLGLYVMFVSTKLNIFSVVTSSILKKRIANVLQNDHATMWLPSYCSHQTARHRFKTRNLYTLFSGQANKEEKGLDTLVVT